ncbi:MAG: hypothetical protein HWN68_04985 [Desulfobacterales bacterium]|nr:hypothetical protein [Desulfobacterales bacterium]
MLKTTHEAASLTISKEELLVAAKNFLCHAEANKDLVLLDNVQSPKFGSSDLLFINKAKTKLAAIRLDNRGDCEKFIIASISYYLWFKELITIGETFFHGKSDLEMYLFSHDFSAAICCLMDSLAKEFRVYLVKYNILQVEDFDEPAIYFQHITLKDFPKDKLPPKKERWSEAISTKGKELSTAVKISAQEFGEFNQLKKLYLA